MKNTTVQEENYSKCYCLKEKCFLQALSGFKAQQRAGEGPVNEPAHSHRALPSAASRASPQGQAGVSLQIAGA